MGAWKALNRVKGDSTVPAIVSTKTCFRFATVLGSTPPMWLKTSRLMTVNSVKLPMEAVKV